MRKTLLALLLAPVTLSAKSEFPGGNFYSKALKPVPHVACPDSLKPPNSRQKAALSMIQDLSEGLQQSKYFINVRPEEFTRQLRDRILHPYGLNQGKTKFCWIAAPCAYSYDKHPEQMVKAMFDLYTKNEFVYVNNKNKQITISLRDYERDAVGSSYFNEKHDSLAGKPADQMLFMAFAANFKCLLNLDRHYDPGDENRPIWAGATFQKEKRVLKSLDFNVEKHGHDLFWIKKKKAEIVQDALNENPIAVLYVNAPSFNKKMDKVAQIRKKFPFILTGSHYILLLKMEKTGNDEYDITFWDDDGIQQCHLSHDLFQSSVFGVAVFYAPAADAGIQTIADQE